MSYMCFTFQGHNTDADAEANKAVNLPGRDPIIFLLIYIYIGNATSCSPEMFFWQLATWRRKVGAGATADTTSSNAALDEATGPA